MEEEETGGEKKSFAWSTRDASILPCMCCCSQARESGRHWPGGDTRMDAELMEASVLFRLLGSWWGRESLTQPGEH